jgi:flagellar basal body-associated protein FliL
MKIRKTAILLCVMVIASVMLGACSLFGGGDDGDGELPELAKRFYWVPGDYFVTNVKDSESGLSKVSLSLAFTKDYAADLDQNVTAVRNIIVKIMLSKTEEELKASNIIDQLEQEIFDALSEFLQIEEFYEVYIIDFVIQ